MPQANDSNNSINDTQAKIRQQWQRPFRFSKGDALQTNKGTYTILERLGQGGFADVYLCQETDLNRQYAVKVLIKEGASLKNEAKIAAQLRHPNIIQVHSFAELNDDTHTPVIVYEYVKGQTLYEKLGQGKLPLDNQTLAMITQIGSALAHAHSKGIYHRDIKPSNIIIDEQGTAYLTDFGLASVKAAPEGESMFSDLMRARLGGTIPYMPPELLRNESMPANAQTDIYSFAVLIYEMLTGQLPYPGRDVQLITNIIDEKIPPTRPSRVNPNLPPGIDDVLTKALAFNPTDRYQTVKAFIDELKPVTEEFAKRNSTYQQAIEHIDNGEWLAAQALLSQLPPKYQDVAVRREQVAQKIRLQKLIDDTKTQINNKEFDKALATLETLREIDPNHEDLGTLHQQATDGKAEQEKRSLAEQYQQAVALLKAKEYQKALDAITIIKKKDPSYPDPEKVAEQAGKVVKEQNELRALYNKGREHAQNEDWEQALAAFTELAERKPNYEDVNQQLSSAQHFYELVSLRKTARQQYKEGQFAEAIDTLDALKNKNARYKADEIASERQKYVNALL
ncbi:MAG: serine/threonine protein kinase, partial [Bacteroidetes bacterium]